MKFIFIVLVLLLPSCNTAKQEDALYAPILSDILLDVRKEFNRPLE